MVTTNVKTVWRHINGNLMVNDTTRHFLARIISPDRFNNLTYSGISPMIMEFNTYYRPHYSIPARR